MTVHELDVPIPAACAEPLERLLDALHTNRVVFILNVSEAAVGWVSAARIDYALQQSLMGAVEAHIWPLLSTAWAIALDIEAGADASEPSLRVHSLRRALTERLETDWRVNNGAALRALPEYETLFSESSGGEEDTLAGALYFDGATDDGNVICASDAATGVGDALFPDSDTLPAFTLTPVASMRGMSEIESNISELNALLDIIVNKQLHAQFQPIVNLRDGSIFGYEALIRGPKGGTLRRPGALFRAAEKARMVSWYDLACQEQCFARAGQQGLRHHLFINMEAEGLAFMDMHERPLAVRARESGLTPASIVVEITERQAVADFPRLMHSLEQLREQGFKIAIDDAGAGYNSLHLIAELRPDFVKIDRSLVRNLDVNGERRALLSALVAYARNIGTHVLAEGSETREELSTLIDMGVTYGQGYLMGKPADNFRGVARETREYIQARYRQRVQREAGKGVTVGGLARNAKTMPPDAPLSEAATSFYKNSSLTGVVVVEDGFARGLLMRHSLEHILNMARSARMEDLLPNETVAQWMQTTLLSVSEEETAADVARQATTRSDLSLETDIVVTDRDGRCAGVLPIRVLMEAVATIKANHAHYADPLTGLPNRVVLEQTVEERLEAQRPLALARIDLTGLEFYNRAYGLPHGDSVIHVLAGILQATLHAHDEAAKKPAGKTEAGKTSGVPGESTMLLAHLGGDDFAILMSPEQAASVCETIVAQFAQQSTLFYTGDQARHGMMEVTERNGNLRRVPLLACRVAVITNRARRFACLTQILDEAHTLLRQLKSQPGHCFAIDRAPANERRKYA